MAFNGNLLRIGSRVIGKIVKSEYQVGYHKLWASDTGRGMDGAQSGSMIGICTKLTVTIGESSQSEMSNLLRAVNVANASVTYFDPETNALKTESFYFGDVEVKLKMQKNGKYEPTQITVIGNKMRS